VMPHGTLCERAAVRVPPRRAPLARLHVSCADLIEIAPDAEVLDGSF